MGIGWTRQGGWQQMSCEERPEALKPYLIASSYAMERLSFLQDKGSSSISINCSLVISMSEESNNYIWGWNRKFVRKFFTKEWWNGKLDGRERAGGDRASRTDDMENQRGWQMAEINLSCHWLYHWSRRQSQLSMHALPAVMNLEQMAKVWIICCVEWARELSKGEKAGQWTQWRPGQGWVMTTNGNASN